MTLWLVVSRNWLVFRRKEFSFPARRERRAYPSAVCEERATKREAKRTAARRVAPKTAWGFVAPRSQSAAAMLPRRALPQAVLGATNHQPIARHHTSLYGYFAIEHRPKRTDNDLSRPHAHPRH